MRVLMIAPPGAGKGTQGALIAAHFDIPHIATGEPSKRCARSWTRCPCWHGAPLTSPAWGTHSAPPAPLPAHPAEPSGRPPVQASAGMAAAGYQPRQDLLSAAGKPLRILRET